MNPTTYLLLALLLLTFSYWVFRRVVKRAYQTRGRLGPVASLLQLFVFVAYFGFAFLYNPGEWFWFWRPSGGATPALQLAGLLLICLGFLVAFGTMGWFGMRKAFGLEAEGLTTTGPYSVSRNPQIIGGYLLVLGSIIQWPSLYALGWGLIYVLIAHWMITTEEEHLAQIFGAEYAAYCKKVPRTIIPKKTINN